VAIVESVDGRRRECDILINRGSQLQLKSVDGDMGESDKGLDSKHKTQNKKPLNSSIRLIATDDFW
jgi:hypothetical protein